MDDTREEMLRRWVNKMRITSKWISDADPDDMQAFERKKCADEIEEVLNNTARMQVEFRISDTWKENK